jgi:hypothetical protein
MEIERANQAALGGQFQNALVRTVHAAMMLRYVGRCQ